MPIVWFGRSRVGRDRSGDGGDRSVEWHWSHAGLGSSVVIMAAPASTPPTARRLLPAQRLLLLASAGVIIGSFLPWIDTGLGVYRGFAGGGIFTFYAGVLGLAGGLVPSRQLATIQGLVMSLVAIGVPLWQLGRLLSKVGFSGWSPGMGLVLVLGSGLYGLRAVWLLSPKQ